MELKVLTGQELIDAGLEEELMTFDRANMQSVFEEAGLEFPEANRRKGLRSNSIFVMAFDGEAIAGYVEYLRSWNNPEYIYLSSVQIAAKYRGGRLLVELLDELSRLLEQEEFVGIEANVQKVNTRAARLYRKIGFKLEPNPANEASWTAKAGKEILTDSSVAKLIQRRRTRR